MPDSTESDYSNYLEAIQAVTAAAEAQATSIRLVVPVAQGAAISARALGIESMIYRVTNSAAGSN